MREKMIINAIKSGIKQLGSNKRIILIYYLANLLFGIVLMLPFRSILNRFVGYSLMGEKLAGRMDMDFLFEFFKENPNFFSTYSMLLLILFTTFWLLSLFLSGGAFSVFASGEQYTAPVFWGNATKYFGRFIRLVLWSIPVFAILFCLQFLWTAIEKIFFGSDPYQYICYWGGWIKVGLRYISFILYFIVLDYARIHAVTTDENRMRISLWQAIKFAFGNFWKTFGLALLLFIAGIIALVIYNPIADLLHAPYSIVILLLFIWQQVYMVFRMVLKLTLYAGEVRLYNLVTGELSVASGENVMG
jgi:hypothetical protein